jgi:DNA-binding IclR family transcriptional regulator
MGRTSPAVGRVVAVVELLAANPDRRFALTEVCRELDLNKATVHALLASLTERAWVLRHPDDLRYALGPRLVAVGGAAAARQLEVVDYARGEMQRLAEELGVQCAASVARGDEIVLLAVVGTPKPFSAHLAAGQRVPLVPPLGTALVAWSSPAEIDRWLRRLGPSATDDDMDRYRGALEAIRRRGYAMSIEVDARRLLRQAVVDGGDRPVAEVLDEVGRQDYLLVDLEPAHAYRISMLAAPVFGADGTVQLALTLFDLPAELDAAEIATFADRLVDAATAVTKAIGGVAPDHT